MTTKIEQLRAAAEAAIQALKDAEAELKDGAYEKITKIMEGAGLTTDDLAQHFGFHTSTPKAKKVKEGASGGTRKTPAITHIDPANPDNIWKSRGLKPRWLQAYLNAGRKIEEFEVKA